MTLLRSASTWALERTKPVLSLAALPVETEFGAHSADRTAVKSAVDSDTLP